MYCTLAEISGVIPETELIQLTDDIIPPATVIEAVVDQAIAAAGTLINGYVGGRYPLPLSTVPELVRSIALDITVYKIYLRRKKKTPPEAVKAAYDDAMKLLRDIQNGKLSLGVDQAGTQIKEVLSGGILVSSAPKVFTENSLRNF